MPHCPNCGRSDGTQMKSPSNHNYPAAFVCYNCDPYGRGFSEDTGGNPEECRAADSESKAMSKANAAAYRGKQ